VVASKHQVLAMRSECSLCHWYLALSSTLECLRASRCREEESHAVLIHDMIVECLKICDRKCVPIALKV
jgi:hypothetical protein